MDGLTGMQSLVDLEAWTFAEGLDPSVFLRMQVRRIGICRVEASRPASYRKVKRIRGGCTVRLHLEKELEKY